MILILHLLQCLLMPGLQTVLMLHGRKEPVLYTQHSAMMLHDALNYEVKIDSCYTNYR